MLHRLDMVAQIRNIYTQFRDQAEPLLEQYRSSRDSSLLDDVGVAGLLAQHMFLHQEVQDGRLTASEIEPVIKNLEEMMVDELEQETAAGSDAASESSSHGG